MDGLSIFTSLKIKIFILIFHCKSENLVARLKFIYLTRFDQQRIHNERIQWIKDTPQLPSLSFHTKWTLSSLI